MVYEKIEFDVSDDVLALGLQGAYFSMGDLQNKRTDLEFEEIREQTIKEILSNLSDNEIKENAILNGFRQLHQAVGRSNRKNISSPENLAYNLLKTGQLPRINLLVDIYNLISIKTFLAIGAHDLAKVSGNIHLRLTKGTEKFLPLGSDEIKPVGPGEYAYIDDDEDVICRLEVRQVEKTKVTENSVECFFIVQGNSETDCDYLQMATDQLIDLIKKFCGGREKLLYAPWISR
jgi:DNA/RNA-binding domain of Phe-tRNA-synthetase-like protein